MILNRMPGVCFFSGSDRRTASKSSIGPAAGKRFVEGREAKQMLTRPVDGISIAVARDGQVVLARGYGMAKLEHLVPVNPQTVCHIASISKNILAAVLLQLVDQGKLRLDDDVTTYMPEAPTLGHHLTVRQLLNQLRASTASLRCPTPTTTSDSN
jgi:CubicO group peptidase (beta-lactamase class C family)